MYPPELKYTETHEWVRDEGGGTASVGLTEFAVNELGDIVFIELPPEGKEIEKGSPFGAVESVKAVFDLNSPVSGKITEVNSPLSGNPDTLKKDAYKKGWLIKLKLSDPSELQELMDSSAYAEKAE